MNTENKNINKDIEIRGFCDYMNLQEDSYLALNLKMDSAGKEEIEVIVYTPSQAQEDEEMENVDFEIFAELLMEDVFPYSKSRNGAEITKKEDYISASISKIKDYNDLYIDIQIVEVFKSSKGLTLEKMISNIKKEGGSLISETEESYKEGLEYNKDPYAYYGVNRKDFF